MRNHARPIALLDAAEEVASITHAHPLGIEGAVIIAMATAAATDTESPVEILQWSLGGADSEPFVSRITTALTWIRSGRVATPAEVRAELGNGIAATESCVTAVYIAARFLADSFESMISFVASCGGDVDTIGAMAGGIWGLLTVRRAFRTTSLRSSSRKIGFSPLQMSYMKAAISLTRRRRVCGDRLNPAQSRSLGSRLHGVHRI
jgi:ADP-ribosylglycohydrolase